MSAKVWGLSKKKKKAHYRPAGRFSLRPLGVHVPTTGARWLSLGPRDHPRLRHQDGTEFEGYEANAPATPP